MLARDIKPIEDRFIELLQHIPGTKEDKQTYFSSHGISVPKTNYATMWNALVYRLERRGAAAAVFDLLLANVQPRLLKLLKRVQQGKNVVLQENDPIIVDDFFFLNGNLRKLILLLFKYMDEKNIMLNDMPIEKERTGAKQSLNKKYEIALSFAGEDRELVEEVANLLKEKGVRLFYDKFEQLNLWGKDLLEHFAKIYQDKAEYCAMFISKYYVDKAWPRFERQQALYRAIYEKKEYILPIRLDDSEVPGLSPSIGYLDARKMFPEEIAKRLYLKIRKEEDFS